MNFEGLIIGVIVFLLIGVFHPIVIKAEYYFTKNVWPVFAIVGVVCLIISLNISNNLLNITMAVLGITCLWSIIELFEQEERVRKGWFPNNPNRKSKTDNVDDATKL
ncbi:MAG: DUF4491 family protein [Lachnospiraceae bacterium]|nr:DUF4491 family protein [Lachnospiraceae bacterium]